MFRRLRFALPAGTIAALAICAGATSLPAPRATPDHLLFMVFDQMRPDYIDRFDLKQFKRLRASSRNYPEAYVGHLSSQTIVSHLVMPTGLPPGALPWVDEVVVDGDGTLGQAGAAYKTSELKPDQMWLLLKRIPRDQFVTARMRDTLGGQVFAIGEKDYATYAFGGPWASAVVTLSKPHAPDYPPCAPAGVNVPAYISSNSRFTVECRETYGTGFDTVYKLDGSRYVPGKDPAHLGGDVWAADVALEIMNRESWSGLFLTFGAIDKVGHMLGEQDGHGLQSVPSEYHLADVLRVADEQLGRILDALQARGLADRTLVVVTADHGGQRDEIYMGNNGTQSCCPFENSGTPKPPYWLEHLNALAKGGIKASYGATSLPLWLADRSPETERAVTLGLKDIPAVTEIYALRRTGDAYRYEQVYSQVEAQPATFKSWAQRHSAELMATMAGPAAPDLVGLLADNAGFGRIGDHGGAQEWVQRIPMIIRVPGEKPATRQTPLRLMDLAPEITRILGLKPAPTAPPPAR
jgi:hypothetical protein